MAASEPIVEEEQLAGIAGSAVGDHPTHADSLGFKPYVEAIAGFLLADATKPPITISIEGEWGSGKSSFLLQLEDAIVGERRFKAFLESLPGWLGGKSSSGSIALAWKKLRAPRAPLTVRFNAWRHDKQDSVWAAFALAFVESLRSEIGFVRAYLGDLRLFLKRLTGVRGWLQLILLLASASVLIVAVIALYLYAGKLSIHDLNALLDNLLTPDAPHKTPANLAIFHELSLRGGWGAFAALGLAGIFKFHKHFKMPLSLNLAKYLAKPDYQGHVTFIESFHLDLKRLIQAYAGKERVFIFVDDLDRCDVPRAAELMQAINLMIGDSGKLIFILGMDREKVAAGVALKYKDLFPFLRESAKWKPGTDNDDFTPLYFGYAYLEKFIQISFSLPIPNDDATLDQFLQESPPAVPSSWHIRLWNYWRNRLALASQPIYPFTDGAGAQRVARNNPSPATPAPVADKVEYHRVEIKEDSVRTRKIVRMVSSLFENNPRRIKQFINTFRLAIFIASDQGIFDRIEAPQLSPCVAPTPEQIGKFVALLLRFPDLRYKLEETPNLLAGLEELSVGAPAGGYKPETDVPHWLRVKGAIELLAHKVGTTEDSPTREKYSLSNLNVIRLFSVLPRATRPPAPSSVFEPIYDQPNGLTEEESDELILADLLKQADSYEDIRNSQGAGPARTQAMTAVMREAIAKARQLTVAGCRKAIETLSTTDPGDRLMSIAVAYARVDPSNYEWLLQALDEFISPFEHYWCIQTLLLYVDEMPDEIKIQVVEILNRHWNSIQRDSGRNKQAEQLRSRASNIGDKATPSKKPRPQKVPTVKK